MFLSSQTTKLVYRKNILGFTSTNNYQRPHDVALIKSYQICFRHTTMAKRQYRPLICIIGLILQNNTSLCKNTPRCFCSIWFKKKLSVVSTWFWERNLFVMKARHSFGMLKLVSCASLLCPLPTYCNRFLLNLTVSILSILNVQVLLLKHIHNLSVLYRHIVTSLLLKHSGNLWQNCFQDVILFACFSFNQKHGTLVSFTKKKRLFHLILLIE